jgi:hypothetical protein
MAPKTEPSSASLSPSLSSENLKEAMKFSVTGSKGKSMADRSKIPPSTYITVGSLLAMQYFCGIYRLETFQHYASSIVASATTVRDLMAYLKDLCWSVAAGDYRTPSEYAIAATTSVAVFSALYVFVGAPLRAGFWTGSRATKHKMHRYMGALYLIQYFLAWIEFAFHYQDRAAFSYMPHFVGINGTIQSLSAYFTFKVLPELDDAGYYSDKAVMSRNFIHENIFFVLYAVFGSCYYNPYTRAAMQSSTGGRILEIIFVFYPYILIRPWYPTTRFSKAGTTHKGRTDEWRRFYEIGTLAVKFFYLWAKYFLGFFVNFSIFLNLPTDEHWKCIHGIFLLNVGTVSLAMFLHTLRFKGVLDPRLTFSIYLGQIYATFSAVPIVLNMFASHPKLCALCSAGLVSNMTRNRGVQAVWCTVALVMLTQTDIEW